MAAFYRFIIPALALGVAACGGGGNPTAPPTATNTPAPSGETFTVTVIVYDDENGNGRHDGNESVWLPDVQVDISGRTGTSEKRTGRVIVNGVPRGTYPVTIRTATLSPFYQPGPTVTVDVPQPTDVSPPMVSAFMPVGANNRGQYLFSGDSISQGSGSSDNRGFRPALRNQLDEYYGRASEAYRGGGGTTGRTADAVLRVRDDVASILPAVTALNWGVNDYYEDGCGVPTAASCRMGANLRQLIRTVRSANSMPCIATLTPTNTGFNQQAPPERNDWVKAANEMIRTIAREERALLIDVGAEFFRQPSIGALMSDHVHPNDAGYAVMADVYFKALTRGTIAGASAGPVFPAFFSNRFGATAPTRR
jgi:lysophospholipase L1-like esterase